MKHLKSHKIFDAKKSFVYEDVRDISQMLQDLKDDGFSSHVNNYTLGRSLQAIEIRIIPDYPEKNWPKTNYIRWGHIEHRISQILDALNNKYGVYKIEMDLRWVHKTLKFDSMDEIKDEEDELPERPFKFKSDKTDLSQLRIYLRQI